MDPSRFNLGQRCIYGFATWVGAAVVISTLASIVLPALVITAACVIGWHLSDAGFRERGRPHLLKVREAGAIVWQLMKGFPLAAWTMLKQLVAVWQMREHPLMTLPDDFDDVPLTIPEDMMPATSLPDNSQPPMVSRPAPAARAPEPESVPTPAVSEPERARADDPNPWAPPAPSQQGRRVGYHSDGSSYVY